MSNGQPDEADRAKAGTLPRDPKHGTKAVATLVPRVLTVADILEASALRVMSRESISSLTTGHYKLDQITGGFRGGFTWLIGADTSWGKSSWLVSVADENIREGKRVCIVSSEDTEEIYGDRLMARRAQIDANAYRDKTLTREDLSAVAEVTKKAESVPVYVDARRWPIEDLEPHLHRLITEQKIDLIAFDYIQEFRSSKRHQDERVKYREIASICRHVAKKNKISGAIFSQLTLDDRSKIPNRHNIRECRDIANASEVILIGFEPEIDIVDPESKALIVPKNTKCLFVDKVKNGPRGAKLIMKWDPKTASFVRVLDPKVQAQLDVDRYAPSLPYKD